MRWMYSDIVYLRVSSEGLKLLKVVRILSQPHLHNIFTGSALKCFKRGEKQLNMTHNRNNIWQI